MMFKEQPCLLSIRFGVGHFTLRDLRNIAATRINRNESFQPCFLCADPGYHRGTGHHGGSADKIALFISPDKTTPSAEQSRAETRPPLWTDTVDRH